MEWRSATKRINSCNCADFKTNRLGTCKHIESVKKYLSQIRDLNDGKSKNSRVEIFIDEANSRELRISYPEDGLLLPADIEAEIDDCLRKLTIGSSSAMGVLNKIAQQNSELVRVSERLTSWNEAKLLARRKIEARDRYAEGLKSGKYSLNILKHELLPYQIEGVLHLAFGERVLLADEMGLGKTVQAIGACALLKEHRGIERVLVVSPASLKSE